MSHDPDYRLEVTLEFSTRAREGLLLWQGERAGAEEEEDEWWSDGGEEEQTSDFMAVGSEQNEFFSQIAFLLRKKLTVFLQSIYLTYRKRSYGTENTLPEVATTKNTVKSTQEYQDIALLTQFLWKASTSTKIVQCRRIELKQINQLHSCK